jgi:hypothetical protein
MDPQVGAGGDLRERSMFGGRASVAGLVSMSIALGCAGGEAGPSGPGPAPVGDGSIAPSDDGGGGAPDAWVAPPPPPPPPPPGDPSDGPADHLLMDDSVHPGGVWGEPLDFHMADYPLSWAIATVHASMLLRSRCIQYSPDAVLSHAIKESRLGCATSGSLSQIDGCFQIESTSAYVELGRLWPARFTSPHAEVIAGDHFESSAIALAHYFIFSDAMFRKYTGCPEGFIAAHPDPRTQQKLLAGAYNRGLWWNSFTAIFTTCADHDIVDCFAHDIATDYARAIVDYTVGLEAAPDFDAPVGWEDLTGYWQRIHLLYPDTSEPAALAAMQEAFDEARAGAATISFHQHIRVVLQALMDVLPPLPSVDDGAVAACTWSYMMGTACEAGGACGPEVEVCPAIVLPPSDEPDAGVVIP